MIRLSGGLNRRCRFAIAAWLTAVLVPLSGPASAREQPRTDPAPCVLQGILAGGGRPLPGATLELEAPEGAVVARTSTRTDGSYRLPLPAAGSYRLAASLPGFTDVTRDVAVSAGSCELRIDLALELAPVSPASSPSPRSGAGALSTSPSDPSAVAGSLGVPLPVVLRPAIIVEFNGRAVKPDGRWLDARRRATALPDRPAAPTAAEAAAARPPAAAQASASARGAKPAARAPAPARLYQGTVSYSVNGSALDSLPYQLRPDRPVEPRPYSRHTFDLSISGPLRIPRLYDGARRTTFALTYSGNRGSSLFDEYATVPTEAVRAGDFSGVSTPLIDPETGKPFANQRIPGDRIHPAAEALLQFIPAPNLPGAARNFHYTTASHSRTNGVTLRVVHQLSRPPAARPPAGAVRTSASLTAQLQIRDTRAEQVNVFPALGGATRSRTIAAPVTITIQRGRQSHALRIDLSTSLARAESRYAHVEDVAGSAGIAGLSPEPFAWGVPTLSFATYSSARDVNPTRRHDARLSVGYGWTRTVGRHTLGAGTDGRFDWSDNQTDPNARGTFVFTGRYTAGPARVPRGAGFDFADFLLGLPQQASVQYGPGHVRIRGRSAAFYVQDDWRRSSVLTITAGLRYELVWPLVEADRQMVTLDATSDFSQVVPVLSGMAGPFAGPLPASLVRLDRDNLAPRMAVAWKAPGSVAVRAGFGVSFNTGSYSTIARRLVGQPPFAASEENLGTLADPLDFADPFLEATIAEGVPAYGVDPDYASGDVQTWNVEISRPFRTIWTASGGYTGKRGTSLDLIRTPNHDPRGANFQWQSADGRSRMHGLTLRLQRRKTRGVGGTVTYTLARAHDNMAVAQNDLDLESEWGLSSFDRRHQLSCNLNVDLPFGTGRAWLSRGPWAALASGWSAGASFTAQSGTPLTPRVTGAQAAGRPLRPDLTGESIALASPSIDLFFNTAAFVLPEPGRFGTAGRNSIIGPGSRLLNASVSRDVRLGRSRVLTTRLDAANLLNLVNYSSVNTTVNSSAFGQITSVRPMRTMTLSAQIRF